MLFPRKKNPFNLTKPPPFISFARIYKFPCLSYNVKDPMMKITYSPKPLRLKEKACDVVLLIARFINACDAVQIRLASEKCNLEDSKTKLWSSENPLRGVAPLLAAVHKVQVSTKRLTALHPDCLQLCLLAKCSKAGFSVLSDDDILEVYQPRDFYLHCYYVTYSLLCTFVRGMICIGLKRFQKALELLYNVVTAPMHVVNAIALEAYKKYILVTLIHSGQFSISPPKCASTTAKNSFKTWSTPYIDVGMRYNDGKISELEAVVVANSSDFEKDKNLGLVKQAVSSLYKRNSEVLDLVASRYSQHGPTC
ncbi:unnamed protein product [Brassica oleracea]